MVVICYNLIHVVNLIALLFNRNITAFSFHEASFSVCLRVVACRHFVSLNLLSRLITHEEKLVIRVVFRVVVF